MSSSANAPSISPDSIHRVFWCLAESHFHQARAAYRDVLLSQANTATLDSTTWRKHIIAGLSCLYGLVRLCDSPRIQSKCFGKDLVIGLDTEAKTRLRIALILAEWADCNPTDDMQQDEEERQLTRALMAVPNAEAYVDTRYAVISAQCRLFLRRRELNWTEQKLKSALTDAQQRGRRKWVYHFALELANMYSAKGSPQGAVSILQTLAVYARRNDNKLCEAVALTLQLGIAVQARNWVATEPLIDALAALVADPALVAAPQVRTRVWVLKAAVLHCQGRLSDAQESCDCARQALREWQILLARQMATSRVSDSGALFSIVDSQTDTAAAKDVLQISGWSYYEAHAWVMLMSAYSIQNQDSYEPAVKFLNLALEGIARGEADSATSQLLPLKLHVFLRLVDVGIAALCMDDAKFALDQALSIISSADTKVYSDQPSGQNALWRNNKDAIALRWAMYLHRTGHAVEATDAYRCVIRGSKHDDLRFAAQINLAVLQLVSSELATPDQRQAVRDAIASLKQAIGAMPSGSYEVARRALLELLQGIETDEPVKAKTHLLACLRISSEISDSVLQGWTLCLLGTLVLPAGQYEQAMRMCAAGQDIAQRANDPLQKAAAIGILSHIEDAVGDPDRCAKLLQIDQQCLEQFNARIQGA
ncbi:mau2 chromatid cohesion factor [Coemansia thaxteri]|uniref:Mau2 chromatid cohesion factor n=1 Tax=Coemansia thaxteri TaxID=2663907 RepID=A0A9W8BKS0_9FUNG|nr:mau2 chromatid cohesion factor [Coemansia thaxteri]